MNLSCDLQRMLSDNSKEISDNHMKSVVEKPQTDNPMYLKIFVEVILLINL